MRIRHGAQRARFCLGIVVTLASAVACAPSPNHAQHTVDEYRQDDDLRKARVAQCRNDPGSLGKTADCINALEAQRLEGIGSFRDLPPMNLRVPPTDDEQTIEPEASR